MGVDGLSDDTIRGILSGTRRIAMVGASAKAWRDSNHVLQFLLDRGFDVTPVNPNLTGQSVHGRTVVASVRDAEPLEMVDIFRASRNVGPVVDAAITGGARVIWMQLGVIDQDAAARARAAGLTVVMDRCPIIEDRRLGPFRHAERH